ncbi:tetratricopeptide repeat protein [Candidatus Dependentiae bacterium]
MNKNVLLLTLIVSIFCTQHSLATKPYTKDAYEKFANRLAKKKKLAEARMNGKRSETNRTPINEDYKDFFEKANELFKEKKHDEAIIYYNKTIGANPQCHQAYFNRGLVFADKGDLDTAQQNYRKAIELFPQYAKAHLMLGEALKKLGKSEEAIVEFEAVLKADPNSFDAHLALGRILSDMHQFEKSIHHFTKAMSIHPNNVQCKLDFANTLNMVNQTERALQMYQELAQDAPKMPTIIYNIAYTLKKLGRVDEAFYYYQKVLDIDPDHVEAHFGLGLSYLTIGDFENGWKEYEWRWKRPRYTERKFSVPQWDGSDLYGKTIMLHAEQGLGDTFQFIRYAKIAKERGGIVVVASQTPLVQLLSECEYIDHVAPLSGPIPPFQVHASLMTLPLILGTTVETVPADIPYLKANAELVETWKQELSGDKNFKIGICWQGNPNYSTPFLRNAVAAKSVQLIDFEPISQIPGVSLYCLQKTTGENQLKNLPEGFIIHQFGPNFDNEHGRFMDTAAVMKNLDLVLTVDTSIAHLAGGLGVPVWVMLPEPADWRWMYIPNNSPWYPNNMLLFRQPEIGNWQSVMQRIIKELRQEMSRGGFGEQSYQPKDMTHDLLETHKKLRAIKEALLHLEPTDEAFERVIKQAVKLCALRNAISDNIEQSTAQKG